ncbi:hypothetical protein [Bifidobacterium parmae]|uniref:Uncharacterized protein n=1 Tax=Bifidobacterium parmae TaxID=361854 RepID=A0A2N5J5G1_9BIFI|nr:hypothetical protein [Bifidobacterium parmae]PLS29436.1 hypothetical protein Uis4E_0310 [Bifidobacterium parmae]
MDEATAEKLAKAAYPDWDICGAAENDLAYVFLGDYYDGETGALSHIAVDKSNDSVHLLVPGTAEDKRYWPIDTKILWTLFYEPGYEKTERGWRPQQTRYTEDLGGKIEEILMSILRREGLDDVIVQAMDCINHNEWDVGISIGFEALLHRRIKLEPESLDVFGRFARQYASNDGYLEDDFLEQYENFKNL